MKLSLHEKVAVAVGIISLVMFAPAYFNLVSSSAPSASGAQVERETVERLQEALVEVVIDDLVVGSGAEARAGDDVFVHYVGQLEDGTTFDTSVTNDDPFAFSLGAGQVITGWEFGLLGMKEGGTRRLTVPPTLAYGSNEIKDVEGETLIPAHSTLVFDIVLLRVYKPLE